MASKLRAAEVLRGPNGNLFYEREGTPDTQSILFVHGLGGTTNAYQALVPELTEFDLVRFDWSGHGRSPVPESTSIDSYVEDCKAVIDHLSLQSVVVVGHSLGGLVSLHLAAKYPDKVKALVLFGPVRPPPEAGQKALAARAEMVRKDGMSAVADTIVSNAFAAASFSERRTAVALAREMLTRQDPQGYALAVASLIHSTLPDFGHIKARTVVVSGDEDKVSTTIAGEATVSEIGNHAEQTVLTGVGHWHMLEAPSDCIQIIRKVAG